ncbi:hypothetical protein BY458DRAFT_572943 [Sporodiniella umbellata]|nr:hypothetical protein BY458DRAFT_572943 [Sporodiniella umbellata]
MENETEKEKIFTFLLPKKKGEAHKQQMRKPSLEKSMSSLDVKIELRNAEIKNGRAATYKFARKNLHNFDSTRSKVGSMVLEFDALAYKQENATSDSSAAWLLLENKSLTSTPTRNNNNQRPSLNNLFTKTNKESVSSSLISSSYAYQSLTRKEASQVTSIISTEEKGRRGKERDSPYTYVEKLRNRNIATDILTKHVASLSILLASESEPWINEFLSRRHDGINALETVFERMIEKRPRLVKKKKKKKKKTIEFCSVFIGGIKEKRADQKSSKMKRFVCLSV